LLFVADVSNILYSQILREEIRDQTEDIKAMKVPMYGWDWLNRRPALLDITCVFGLCLLVYGCMHWNLNNVTVPIYDALECTCLSQGDNCREAQQFNEAWWDNYWMKVVPGVFKEVDALKAGVPGASMLVSDAGSMTTASALLFHEQLESRVMRLSGQNEELQETIEKLEKEMKGVKKAPSHHRGHLPGTAPATNHKAPYESNLKSFVKGHSRALIDKSSRNLKSFVKGHNSSLIEKKAPNTIQTNLRQHHDA